MNAAASLPSGYHRIRYGDEIIRFSLRVQPEREA